VIDRSKTRDTPKMPMAAQGRRLVRDSGRGNHLGQRSCANATKGRTYERKRSDQNPTQNFLRARGMSRCLLKFSKRSLRIEIYAASAI